jgi:hypothetical protein
MRTAHDTAENGPVHHRGESAQLSGLSGPSIVPASRPDFPFAPPLLTVAPEAKDWKQIPLAPVALQGFVAGFRAFRAPLQPDGLAVWGQGRGENKPTARQSNSCAQTRGVDMIRHDPEIEELRAKVHCVSCWSKRPHAGSLIERRARNSA